MGLPTVPLERCFIDSQILSYVFGGFPYISNFSPGGNYIENGGGPRSAFFCVEEPNKTGAPRRVARPKPVS